MWLKMTRMKKNQFTSFKTGKQSELSSVSPASPLQTLPLGELIVYKGRVSVYLYKVFQLISEKRTMEDCPWPSPTNGNRHYVSVSVTPQTTRQRDSQALPSSHRPDEGPGSESGPVGGLGCHFSGAAEDKNTGSGPQSLRPPESTRRGTEQTQWLEGCSKNKWDKS